MKQSDDQQQEVVDENVDEETVESTEEQVDYKDKYLRALADYQNLIKRTQQEKEEFYKYAHESFVIKLIPVLDHLERAEEHTDDKGIELIYKEIRKIVEDLGLEVVHVKPTDEFDPTYMDCIEAETDGNKLEEIRPGYKFKGKVIRPVQVKVVKK